MGAGQIDPNRALDPGLIYDTTPQDYVNFMCSMNFTRKQVLAITRSKDYRCSELSYDLNYPSFITFYDGESARILEREFRRTVTNVGNGASKYNVTVNAPEGSIIKVTPESLVFGKKNEKSYLLPFFLMYTRREGTCAITEVSRLATLFGLKKVEITL